VASKYSGLGPALGLGGYILAGQLIKFEAGPAAIFSVLLAAISALGLGEILYCPTALQRFSEKELRGLSMNFLCNENPIYVFPEKKLRDLGPNFHIMCL
jgi:hypothetical protein